MADIPVLHVISDSLGDSAATIAVAAASQFTSEPCNIERMTNVQNIDQISTFIDRLLEDSGDEQIVLFYTIANPPLRHELEAYIKNLNIAAVDLIGPAISAIAEVTGMQPKGKAGLIHRTDSGYYSRVAAMEFAVDHDDGRNPQDLKLADIVLIGASRTSKTPLSIFLATLGYSVANVPLAVGVEPPAELFDLNPAAIFGLTSEPKLLAEIRTRRLGNALGVAGKYADQGYVMDDLDDARALMRRLGCIVVRTDNRAIEETAQEILRYVEATKAI